MIRRPCLFLVIMSVLLSFAWPSYGGVKKPKYTGSLLTGCSLYQIGAEEFVLKLNGKKLPEPRTEFNEDSMYLILDHTMASQPEEINASVAYVIDASPLLYSFTVENVSNDKVSIRMQANAELELQSVTHTSAGWGIRIMAVSEAIREEAIASVFASKQKPSVTYPDNVLPFAVDTRITVELRDAELRDVLRLLMSQAGQNIILDPSFPADVLVTLSLFDVRIDDVINHLMRTYDIACYDSGQNTTIFGTREGLYKLSGGKIVKSFNISYADIAQAVTMLRNLTAIQESELITDTRTRTLYVNTNPAKMIEIEDLISKIDVPSKQIMIRASIFEFSERASKQVSTALNMAYDEWQIDAGGTGGIRVDYAQDRTVAGTRNPRTARTLQSVLEALEEEEKGRIIANPSVIAVDGQAATIELTQTYTYSVVRDDAGNAISQQEDVGPTLTFTPRIERDGYVYLELSLSTGDVLSTGTSGAPITSDRSVTTRVRVRNGMPFVVGGLFQDNKTRSKAKIPVLGDIPLLGQLFRSSQNSSQRNQVVMIVTPYILDSK